MITYKKLTPANKKEYAEIMVQGNNNLESLATELKYSTVKKLRVMLFKTNPCCINNILKYHKDLHQKQIKLIEFWLPSIQKVRDIEKILIEGYSATVRKLSNKYKNACKLPLVDCMQIAYMALLDAIYGYKSQKYSFITYAYKSIKNRFINLCLETNPFSRLNNKCVKLLERFNKLKESRMVSNLKYDDDTIIELLDLSKKEKKNLQSALLSLNIVNESCFVSSDGQETIDYTAFRKNIDSKSSNELYYVKMALEETTLSDIERKIVDTFLCPYYGWQSDLAKNNINPSTNKPYSNRGIAFILEQALEKIKHTYFSKYNEKEVA